ncbi:MAG: hypothetical protein ACRDRL_26990 [Sciscionella sp.]
MTSLDSLPVQTGLPTLLGSDVTLGTVSAWETTRPDPDEHAATASDENETKTTASTVPWRIIPKRRTLFSPVVRRR